VRARDLRLRVTEEDCQQQIIDLAGFYRWDRRYHTHDSRRSVGGFPDLVMVHVRDKRVIFAEIKAMKGKLSPEQLAWLWDLATAGAEVYVFHPANWNLVVDVLSGAHRSPNT
jgi:hypothetical protein